MLKISIKHKKIRRLLVLEGKLVAPWTIELIRVARQDHAAHLDRELVIELRNVTDIDADGEEALYCLMIEGAKFRGGGLYAKQILKQLAERMRQSGPIHE